MTVPFFGALPGRDHVHFRVMAGSPGAGQAANPSVQLVLHTGAAAGTYDMPEEAPGVAAISVARAAAGDRYSYRLGGGEARPDPASRFQPEGVHGPSEVIDANGYAWRHQSWTAPRREGLVVYELHVGTFTPEGTFDAARRRLPELCALGITAVELMPLADFPGRRNWGYDGVSLFAPSRAYGRPDDLRRLVDDAHGLGLSVLVDVVYNHLGPEGAYVSQFHPCYITMRHPTPWGGAVNIDGCGSETVRAFIIDNALHWVREYRLDGLRLDATHALIDEGPVHLVSELAARVRAEVPWPVIIHAEDHRNLAAMVQPATEGGWELDGLWADDFHHVVRRAIAGDSHGYYEDFTGDATELAATIRQGWLYTGQLSRHMKGPRGTDASGVPMSASVVCLQNHDQIGNRAFGDRLHHTVDLAAWHAASVVLLTSPMTPLLFMGQEWGATSPFLYFTDLEPELGHAVTQGRRREFKDFPAFGENREVPDPQAESTFVASKLHWEEREQQPHSATLALYQRLLALRAENPALQASRCPSGEAWAHGDGAVVMRRRAAGDTFVVVAALREGCEVPYAEYAGERGPVERVLTTEDPAFAADPAPPEVAAGRVVFRRPGAVVMRTPVGSAGTPRD